ncbi:MAG: winged helix-turn-helix transcriptional regulator [Armatimonadetes bacterium]|nr:winged helix-turn-helix transcriptional regulator [Armatimonadota bacterium]
MRHQITGVRQDILVFIRQNGPQTVQALSSHIGITPVGVRKHLDALEIDGLIKSTTERRPVGRPVQLYALTEAADDLFPKMYHAALISIIRQILRIGGEELLHRVLEGRLEELEATYHAQAAGATTLEERVAALARVRDEAGYMAGWERTADGFLLVEHNCALCRATREFPEICAFELRFMRRVLGDGVSITRVEHQTEGAHRCAYLIREA